MRVDDVLIVGGGAAGLSTAGALKAVGVRATVLDRDEVVGASWLRRYDRLHLHTIRAFSGLAHFGIPRHYPKYLSRAMYAEYLQQYRQELQLDVEHNCVVHRISANGAHSNGDPRFRLQTNGGERGARCVVVATGNFLTPIVPHAPGIELFEGDVRHAAAYAGGKDYASKRVLVVGIGNTGAEIATDLVEQGADRVTISIRTSPPVVPRDFLGTPVQLFGIVLSRFPTHVSDRIGAAIARVAIGDLRRYGLRKPQWFPFSARRIPVIDVGFVASLKSRRIEVRPAVARFTNSGAVFADGSVENFDAVIFATGFGTGLASLLDLPGLLDEREFPVFSSGMPTSHPGLYFMGFFESHRGHLFEIARASRRLARTIARDLAGSPSNGRTR